MGEKRRRYAREFKVMAVRQVLEGESLRGTARELGISWKILDRWKSEYLKDPKLAFPGHGCRQEPEDDLTRLRRENAELRRENEFLKKTKVYIDSQRA
jgi:transposase